MLLYDVHVLSRLGFAICLWGNSILASDVFIAQKRIFHVMFNVPNKNLCRDLFRVYNVLTFTSLYIFELFVDVFWKKSEYLKIMVYTVELGTRQTYIAAFNLTQISHTSIFWSKMIQ